MLIAALAAASAAATPQAPGPDRLFELRQYKIVEGERDRFIDLFDREFVETQEAEGMELVGQFRDRTDPDRFTWIRAFPDVNARQRSLTVFYSSPTWLAHRGVANPLLIDNDNVLLLRPAWPGAGFPSGVARPTGSGVKPERTVVITIHYLWKRPDEGFTAFFKDQMLPALQRAGLPLAAALVLEDSKNTFPRLPVREGEKLFVWAAAVASEAAWRTALEKLERDPAWPDLRAGLSDFEERQVQRLLLDPTSRSRLR